MTLEQRMTRAEVDRARATDFALGGGPLRPRNSATLILLDGLGTDARVLLGRRHHKHVFMPGKFVFPGGRTHRSDSRVAIAAPLHPLEEARIAGRPGHGATALARAVALAAIRETYEEAGLLVGRAGTFTTRSPEWQGFADQDVQPALDCLRFIARAITPPGRVRRFDSRFLAAFRSDVAVELPDGGRTDELEELVWLPIADAKEADIPGITKKVLEGLERRLASDPNLTPGGPAPFYRMHRNRFICDLV